MFKVEDVRLYENPVFINFLFSFEVSLLESKEFELPDNNRERVHYFPIF